METEDITYVFVEIVPVKKGRTEKKVLEGSDLIQQDYLALVVRGVERFYVSPWSLSSSFTSASAGVLL